ncbi:hypothetical protein M5689_019354 [Euphorbia peplus]|nr:hypothetical protein M5689_019354 [Euphorbia peplus]
MFVQVKKKCAIEESLDSATLAGHAQATTLARLIAAPSIHKAVASAPAIRLPVYAPISAIVVHRTSLFCIILNNS